MTITPTSVEAAIIRDLVTTYAADYYGGPFHFGRADTARYVTEGHADREIPRINWRDLLPLVAAEIDARPEALTMSREDRDAARAARNAEAERLVAKALLPFRTGRLNEALALIEQAELAAPLHRVKGRSWSAYRDRIQDAAAQLRRA